MALVGRVTFLWILTSFFLLFVVLKLDGTINWFWLVVFVPMWILDVVTVVYIVVTLLYDYRRGDPPTVMDDFNVLKRRKFILIGMFVLKIIFMMLLCLKLDGFTIASYLFVCIPLWIVLAMLFIDSFIVTWREGKKYRPQ